MIFISRPSLNISQQSLFATEKIENLVSVNKRFGQNQGDKSRCTCERLALGRSRLTQRKCRTPFAGLRTAIARCVSSSLYIVITAASIASKTHHSADEKYLILLG